LSDENKSSVAASGDSITDLAERLRRLETETARLAQLVSNFSERLTELTEKAPSETKLATPKLVPPTAKRSSSKPDSSVSK
jgi:archaellum component FlaC